MEQNQRTSKGSNEKIHTDTIVCRHKCRRCGTWGELALGITPYRSIMCPKCDVWIK